jgi:hypothetical protein
MTDSQPIYLDHLRKAQAHIDAGQFVDAGQWLIAAAGAMGSHPERDTVLRWAEQCRAKAKTMRFRSLAYLAMRATPEPAVDLAGLGMQGRA